MRDFGIQFRVTGHSPRRLIIRFALWIERRFDGTFSTAAFFLNVGQDIYLCKDPKVWNADMLETGDYQFLYDILEHETCHGVFADLLDKKEKMERVQDWFDYYFNLATYMIVPRHFFEPLNTPSLPDSTVEVFVQ
jgi:hypothetical protein